eukprot:3818440-Rhodomonas_salina.2
MALAWAMRGADVSRAALTCHVRGRVAGDAARGTRASLRAARVADDAGEAGEGGGVGGARAGGGGEGGRGGEHELRGAA